MSEISISESARLIALEKVIQRGLSNFIEVGEALLSIRDERLYRIEHKTFEDYCRKKWSFTRHQANRLIGASAAVANLEPTGSKPASERQMRPLVPLEPEQQREAWEAAVEASDGKPTAKHVEAAVENIRHRPISEPEFTPKQKAQIAESEKDSETLWLLKSYWKKAGKKDRAAFRKWIDSRK